MMTNNSANPRRHEPNTHLSHSISHLDVNPYTTGDNQGTHNPDSLFSSQHPDQLPTLKFPFPFSDQTPYIQTPRVRKWKCCSCPPCPPQIPPSIPNVPVVTTATPSMPFLSTFNHNVKENLNHNKTQQRTFPVPASQNTHHVLISIALPTTSVSGKVPMHPGGGCEVVREAKE